MAMGPLQDIFETWARGWNAENSPAMFVRKRRWLILAISAVVLIPCFWHRRIEAGDLASHVYNAWLAQLIEKGQAPGLYLAKQWDNILFDVALSRIAKVVGFPAAQKIIVGICVLIFFWGVFAFVAAITEKPPWLLTPCIAMLAYGYSFNMGFMNYYLSLGLACFSLALFCRPRGVGWVIGAFLVPITLLAHPIGFLWLIGTLMYTRLRNIVPGWWKVILPLTVLGILVAANQFMMWHAEKYVADWYRGPFYVYNGADQLALYGERYYWLAGVAFFLGVFFAGADIIARRKEVAWWKPFALAFELYALAFCAIMLLPENFHLSLYSGWIGLLGSRLTTVSAIFGLCFMGSLNPRRWHFAGFAACALVFFGFLWQDTEWLNRLEANAESITKMLPAGTRVIPTVWAPTGSRVSFIGHAVDRACIGHCFNYANYEPASGEFRVRVRPGSRVATASSDDSEEMESGEHEMQDEELPLKEIYQCDAGDLTKLCIRDLVSGEKNGRIGYKPPSP
jgi:hypothetical protein